MEDLVIGVTYEEDSKADGEAKVVLRVNELENDIVLTLEETQLLINQLIANYIRCQVANMYLKEHGTFNDENEFERLCRHVDEHTDVYGFSIEWLNKN